MRPGEFFAHEARFGRFSLIFDAKARTKARRFWASMKSIGVLLALAGAGGDQLAEALYGCHDPPELFRPLNCLRLYLHDGGPGITELTHRRPNLLDFFP